MVRRFECVVEAMMEGWDWDPEGGWVDGATPSTVVMVAISTLSR
jgi:hypothetical protein